ncbi:MAG: VCBS repeat-containing protein [Saprospiraceae bacterium]|nr:VCBS repeat-containing protein [Saprospiraceae bacterium]
MFITPKFSYFLIFFGIFICSCADKENEEVLFSLLNPKETGIFFNNELFFTEEYNPYTFKNFFNGGGVGIGDINNDGLMDIYFAGNLSENKLYLNKGNLKFEDITDKAGVSCKDVWSTGVTFVDINADGWMDIYICKSGRPVVTTDIMNCLSIMVILLLPKRVKNMDWIFRLIHPCSIF